MKESELIACMDAVLGRHGFQRRAKSWSRANNETILVVDLQKAPAGHVYYINLGIFVRCLSESAAPRINMCHITDRLDTLVEEGIPARRLARLQGGQGTEQVQAALHQLSQKEGIGEVLNLGPEAIEHILKNRPKIDRALDLDETMDCEERKAVITHAVETVGLAFLQKCDSVAKIYEALRIGALQGAAVWKVVHDHCKTRGMDAGKERGHS